MRKASQCLLWDVAIIVCDADPQWKRARRKGETERGPSSTSNTFSQQHLQLIWRKKNDGVGWKIVTAVWRLCSCDLFPHPCPLSWDVFFFWMCCVMQSYSFKCHFLCPNFPTFLIIFHWKTFPLSLRIIHTSRCLELRLKCLFQISTVSLSPLWLHCLPK